MYTKTNLAHHSGDRRQRITSDWPCAPRTSRLVLPVFCEQFRAIRALDWFCLLFFNDLTAPYAGDVVVLLRPLGCPGGFDHDAATKLQQNFNKTSADWGPTGTSRLPWSLAPRMSLVVARKHTIAREILLWMTPSEAPKALQASVCSELLDRTGASCWISAQH